MSESVRIGGIGKNPAIDKINSLNAIDIKNYASDKMKQAVLSGHAGSYTADSRKAVPIFLDKVDWEGNTHGREQGTVRMAGNKQSGGQDAFADTGRIQEALRRSGGSEVSRHSQTAGNIHQSGRKQDSYLQLAGQALAGAAGLSGSSGDAESD